MTQKPFCAEISNEIIAEIKKTAHTCRGDILTMTTLSGSGHPGGSLSSIDMLSVLYKFARVNPNAPHAQDRDRIIVSNGHISPAVYAILGRSGFFSIDDAIAGFRKAGSPFEGHIDIKVPGVEWITGNLGQGFSSAVGVALAHKKHNDGVHTFVVMGDGENQKGQIVEARRVARKYKLNNLTVLIDYNLLQISGDVREVMYQDLKAEYEATGWTVREIDGHDITAIYDALSFAVNDATTPVCILARTVMGKGVSFMENDEKWHGSTLSEEEYIKAIDELNGDNQLARYKLLRASYACPTYPAMTTTPPSLSIGTPIVYTNEKKTDNRSAFGSALADVGRINVGKMLVFDCDLAGSVKTSDFAACCPDYFIQTGIQEHSTASIAAAASKNGFTAVWADFGVFAADEVFNHLRLNEINKTHLKVVATHVGLNVGEDGKTHHGINYIALMRALFHTKLVIPADPNQTDRVTRWMMNEPGNVFVAMGRAKLPVVTKENGEVFFDGSYSYTYGKTDVLREGTQAAIITCGAMVPYALIAYEQLKAKGIDVAVYNVSSPLVCDNVFEQALQYPAVLTYEDHNVYNGLGLLSAGYMMERGYRGKLVKLGVQEYARSGAADDVYALAGLAPEAVVAAIEKAL